MTSPHPADDEDSLYDEPIIPPPTTVPTETVLPREHALQIDRLLDSEQTPPSSRASIASLSDSHTTPSTSRSPIQRHDDQLFDSDENQISTSTSSSSSSSTTTVPERPSFDAAPRIPSPAKPAATFLSRASATFYKAFRKKKPASVTAPPPTPSTQITHSALLDLFTAQLATLRSARTGFVDLSLVTPLTARTLEGVALAGARLRDFGALERRVATLREEVEADGRATDREIRAKEGMLVHAKVRLAEVSDDVERLRHQLRLVQRRLAEPGRGDRKLVRQLRKEVAVCREARRHVEKRLEENVKVLDGEKAKLGSVENHFRDIEGDWA